MKNDLLSNFSKNTYNPIGRYAHKKEFRVTRRGKNWYVLADNVEITINAHGFTIPVTNKRI